MYILYRLLVQKKRTLMKLTDFLSNKIFRNSSITLACMFVSMLLCVQGYPTGAPPEACRHMIPGHGVPAQTGTSNPYKVMTSKTTFSCPGDTITGQ